MSEANSHIDQNPSKSLNRSVIFKILAFIVILTFSFTLIFYINEKGYTRINKVIDDYNSPNDELRLLKDLRDEISNMMNLQQYEVYMEGKNPLRHFKKDNRTINQKIDSLKVLMANDPTQISRIDKIDSLLESHNLIFSTYLKVRYDYDLATNLKGKFGNIRKVLSTGIMRKDTSTSLVLKYEYEPIDPTQDDKLEKIEMTPKSVRHQEQEPTTTEGRKFHLLPAFLRRDKPSENKSSAKEEEKRFHLLPAFLRNIFNKEENKSVPKIVPPEIVPLELPKKQIHTRIRREPKLVTERKQKIEYKYDTIQIAKRDSLLSNIQLSLDKIQRTRQENELELRNQEILLINTNDQIIGQILTVVRQLEDKQTIATSNQHFHSQNLASESIVTNKVILWVVSLITLSLSLWLMFDFYRLNRARKRLEKAKQEAEFHSQSKQAFLANMSHEIRTPLQSIVGYSELLSQKSNNKEVKTINNSSKYLLHIVNEILDYDKIISGKYNFENANFSVTEAFDEVWNICLLNNKAQDLELINDYQFDEDLIFGDSFRLKQIILNLLNNAIKYTNEGSVVLSAKTYHEGDKIILEFDVTDTGIGIPEDKQQSIFNKYEQSDKTHITKGSGLGLSIAKELIEGQNGNISFVSKVNEGSSFTVKMPFMQSEVKANDSMNSINVETSFLDAQLFFVEDDRVIRQLIAAFVKDFVREFKIFKSINEVISSDFKSIDGLMSDIRLNGESGIDLVRQLRERGFDKKCIAVTAQALPEEHKEILNAGFDDILVKPFTKSSIREKLIQCFPDKVIQQDATLLNFSGLKKLTEDKDLIEKVKKDFYSDTLLEINKLRNIPVESFSKDAYVLVHRVSGRLLQMGSIALGEKWREMEHQIKDGRIISQSKEFHELIDELEKLIQDSTL